MTPRLRLRRPVRARSLAWLGLPTDDVDAAAALFTRQLGVGLELRDGDFAVLRLASGQAIELFGPSPRCQPQFRRVPSSASRSTAS